jgi:hypothetical protein
VRAPSAEPRATEAVVFLAADIPTMSAKTYSGSCHCGAVRFEADIDLAAGVNKCNCGIRTFGRGDHGPGGGPFCFVNVAALDDVDADELAASPLRIFDGRSGHYDRAPADTRLL